MVRWRHCPACSYEGKLAATQYSGGGSRSEGRGDVSNVSNISNVSKCIHTWRTDQRILEQKAPTTCSSRSNRVWWRWSRARCQSRLIIWRWAQWAWRGLHVCKLYEMRYVLWPGLKNQKSSDQLGGSEVYCLWPYYCNKNCFQPWVVLHICRFNDF